MAEASVTNPPENGTSKNSKISPTYQIGASLYMEEHLSDIIITLNENGTVWRFPAHSIVLAARSNVFQKMLLGDFIEKRTREIQIQDVSPKTLKKFLRFLYIGDANLEYWKEAFDLLKVGHRYLMEPLLQTCSQYLQVHINLSNVLYIYIKTATFNVINLNSKEIPNYQIGTSLYMKELLSDIIITLNENGTVWRFPAHRIVLSDRSNVFKKMLLDEKRSREIRLQDMSPETLKKFLRFLYIGDANLECWKEAFDLLKVGRRYLMEPLVQTCSQYLQKHANISNVCYIYRKSAIFNVINLKDFCLEMMQSTACIILRSHEFEFLDEESVINIISSPSLNIDNEMCVINATIRWAANQCCRQSKPITEENISQMMIPFVKYLNTASITRDEIKNLPTFLRGNKNVFSRKNFCISQHLKNNANHVNFKIIDFYSNFITYNCKSVILFTFNVDYPLFLIAVNLVYGNKLYNDDYVILHTKTASVTTTVFQCSVGNNTPQICPYSVNGAAMSKMEVLLNSSVLLRPHTVYQLGLRSNSRYFNLNGQTKPKSIVTFPKTGLFPINEVDYTDSAPFTIHTDSFWGVTKLLYLRTPVPHTVPTEIRIFYPFKRYRIKPI